MLDHIAEGTVFWPSSGLWNPSQQSEFESDDNFSKSTALTELSKNKMHSVENFIWARYVSGRSCHLSLMSTPHHYISSEIPNNAKVFVVTKIGLCHLGISWRRAQLCIPTVTEGTSHWCICFLWYSFFLLNQKRSTYQSLGGR